MDRGDEGCPAHTTGPPPHLAPSADDGPILLARADPGQQERHRMVPVFTGNRSTGLASSFAPAASPRLRRRPSPWPPHRHAKPATESATHTGWPCTAPRPISTRFEPVPRLRSFTTDSSSYTVRSRSPDPARLAVPDRPGFVSAASRPPRRLPEQTALSSHPAAATARRGGLAPPSIPSASRRTGASWRTFKLSQHRMTGACNCWCAAVTRPA